MKTRGYVTVAQTKQALQALYHTDQETNLRKALLRAFEDQLRPVDTKGRWRPSRLLIVIAVIVGATISVFIYSSLGVQR